MKPLQIVPCLLDIYNPLEFEGFSVSAALNASGRQCLWDQRPSTFVDTIVIHYISACDVDSRNPFATGLIMKIFCDLAVSSHYLILRDGTVFHLVPDEKRAWHCGGSIMPPPDNRTGVNDFSIGIELVALHDSGFTSQQYSSLKELRSLVEKKLGGKCGCVGHEDIAGHEAVKRGLRKDVKADPGPLFDWSVLDIHHA